MITTDEDPKQEKCESNSSEIQSTLAATTVHETVPVTDFHILGNQKSNKVITFELVEEYTIDKETIIISPTSDKTKTLTYTDNDESNEKLFENNKIQCTSNKVKAENSKLMQEKVEQKLPSYKMSSAVDEKRCESPMKYQKTTTPTSVTPNLLEGQTHQQVHKNKNPDLQLSKTKSIALANKNEFSSKTLSTQSLTGTSSEPSFNKKNIKQNDHKSYPDLNNTTKYSLPFDKDHYVAASLEQKKDESKKTFNQTELKHCLPDEITEEIIETKMDDKVTIQGKRNNLIRADSVSSASESIYSLRDHINRGPKIQQSTNTNENFDVKKTPNYEDNARKIRNYTEIPKDTSNEMSKYKSLQNIPASMTDEMNVIPIKPPRRSRSEMSNIKYKDSKNADRITKNHRKQGEIQQSDEIPTVTAYKYGMEKERRLSEYIPPRKTIVEESVKRYVSEIQLQQGSKNNTSFQAQFSDVSDTNTVIPLLPKNQNMSSKKPIARAKSDRYLTSTNKQMKKSSEGRPMALSMNALTQSNASISSRMTDHSVTMSELELSSCCSEQTVFSTASRGTVLKKRPEEDTTDR